MRVAAVVAFVGLIRIRIRLSLTQWQPVPLSVRRGAYMYSTGILAMLGFLGMIFPPPRCKF